jgi:flagellin-like protein
MRKMETTIERAWELESQGDVPEDHDYHNSLTLLPRAHRGSDQPLNKVVDGKKNLSLVKVSFAERKVLGGDTEKMDDKKRSLKNEEEAVSPVVGVIMMIAITVVIAAVVAAFSYGIIGGVKKAPNCALVVEDAVVDSTQIKVIHHGGDTIINAFNGSGTVNNNFKNIQVKINGVDQVWANVTGAIGDDDTNFESGEQITLGVSALASGDTISMVFTPTGDILQRVSVMG